MISCKKENKRIKISNLLKESVNLENNNVHLLKHKNPAFEKYQKSHLSEINSFKLLKEKFLLDLKKLSKKKEITHTNLIKKIELSKSDDEIKCSKYIEEIDFSKTFTFSSNNFIKEILKLQKSDLTKNTAENTFTSCFSNNTSEFDNYRSVSLFTKSDFDIIGFQSYENLKLSNLKITNTLINNWHERIKCFKLKIFLKYIVHIINCQNENSTNNFNSFSYVENYEELKTELINKIKLTIFK
jgi:hypothetical protein